MGSQKTRLWPAVATFSVAAIALVLLSHHPEEKATFSNALAFATIAPPAPDGWTVSDTSIGATELEAGETVRALNFSDYLYKTYRCGGLTVQLYVGYWIPGKMDPLTIHSHRPDICWIRSGGIPLTQASGFSLAGQKAGNTKPGRFGRFQFPSTQVEVLFWHRVGSDVLTDSEMAREPGHRHWEGIAGFLRSTLHPTPPPEQLVYRLSTNEKFRDVANSALWPGLCQSLKKAGLMATN